MSNLPRIYLSSPHMGAQELEFVKDAFATNWIAPLGPHVDAFEAEFVEVLSRGENRGLGSGDQGSGYPIPNPQSQIPISPLNAAALSSGTAALHLALRAVGIGPGDEVLCSTFTFAASANPILYERATPVFIDSDTRSWNMDPALLAEAIVDRIKKGKKPKAVILVHLYGQSADLDPIAATCEQHGIPLIEDAAEALGAVYYGDSGFGIGGQGLRSGDQGSGIGERGAVTQSQIPSPKFPISRRAATAPGTRGLCGIFSFNGNKIITTSGGGMLVARDAKLIERARFWATQARDPAPHYQHSELGFNYRLSNVLAGIGRGQLRVLAERVEARRRNCAYYQEAFKDLPGVAFMPEADFGRCTRWLTCITIDPPAAGTDREKVREALAAQNIEARPLWKPMHLQPIFQGSPTYGGAVSAGLFDRGLCLPSGSNLRPEDLERVATAVRKAFRR